MIYRKWLGILLVGCFSAAAWGQTNFQNPIPIQSSPSNQTGIPAETTTFTQATKVPDVPEQPEPHLDAIYPSTVYPNEHGKYDFEIIGKNLPKDLSQCVIEISREGPTYFETDMSKCDVNTKPCLQTLVQGQVLSVRGFKPGEKIHIETGGQTGEQTTAIQPGKDKSSIEIQVRAGNKISNEVKLTFGRFTKHGIQLISAIAFGILVLIVLLVAKRIGTYKIEGKGYGLLTAFLLDKETNTYSLSKGQLVFWTGVIAFGYIYLFFCRTLVQGAMDWPAIPDNLPQLFMMSVGTTVAATGITLSRGSKGAGPIRPSFADFISTGGLVAGDRFQFFVWTLVGGLAFLSLLFQSDPATLEQLPAVPEGFLYLMGVSSAGYLGGKLVRKPGPVLKAASVIDVVDVPNDDAQQARLRKDLLEKYGLSDRVKLEDPLLIVKLEGDNLDADARGLRIDDQVIEAYRFWIKAGQRQEQSAFCTQLYLGVCGADAFLEGQHLFALINSDGQVAEVRFPKDSMIIESVVPPELSPGTNPQELTVKGQRFAEGTTAKWKDAQGQENVAQSSDIKRVSNTEMKVKVVPGDLPVSNTQVKGTLTLISPARLRAKTDVTIGQPKS